MLRDALAVVRRKGIRVAAAQSVFFLPAATRRRIERHLRGREEFIGLQASDRVVVSCGKSGRTWVRTLLSRFFQMRYELGAAILINEDNMHVRHPAIPKIFFTHDTYLKYYTGNFNNRSEYKAKPTLLLVRHPAAVAASQYYQWQHRILPRKKWLNEYPLHGASVSLFELMMHENAGLPYVVNFLNTWGRELVTRKDLTLLRYEDMLAEPREEFLRLLQFVGFEPTPAEIADCVAYSSFENMRQLEQQGVYFFSGRAMKINRSSDPNSYKVRQGSASGWRRDLTPDQIEQIESYIEAHLEPGFGYLARERSEPAAAPALALSEAVAA